jgi:hypothetical protein
MSRDNPLWGTERIRGELLKLGIVVSKRSIRRYRWRKPTPAGSQGWRTFLSNQLKGIWAADLLVVHTINYRVLHVLFFIRHDPRELIHFNVTSSPTAAWVWQQLIEATPWGRHRKYLIHDRDAVYGRTFGVRLAKLGMPASRHRSGPLARTPSANASCAQYERSVWTTRSSSTSDTSMLFSPSTSTTTTLSAPTGALVCRVHYLEAQLATEPCSGDRCWEAYTTSTPGQREMRMAFCPPSTIPQPV